MGRPAIDLTGQRFGMLTVISKSKAIGGAGKHARWVCKCDCGNLHEASGCCLKSGDIKSCGCLPVKMHLIHGHSNSSLYNVWNAIKQRCRNPNYKNWAEYGGRGIKLYEPWQEDFAAFKTYIESLEHYGERGYTIDRIDNNGNYEPGNLRMATKVEQATNRRNTIYYEYRGMRFTIRMLHEITGVKIGTLHDRYRFNRQMLVENEIEKMERWIMQEDKDTWN